MSILRKTMAALVLGSMVAFFAIDARAEQSQHEKTLAAAHHEAAVDAEKKAVFHEEMEKHFVTGAGASKIDMVGHCRYWADYYRKLAVEEEKAAKDLE